MSEHHPALPPSSFPALQQCSRYKSSPHGSDDASLGTEMHVYQAHKLDGREQPEYVHMKQSDFEDCDYIRAEALDFIKDQCPGAGLEIEKRVELYDDDLNLVTFGTCDLSTHNDRVALVLDWKGGLDFRPDVHDYTAQTATYALCKMREHGIREAICVEAYIRPRKLHFYTLSYDEAVAIVGSCIARQRDPNGRPQVCEFCHWCDKFLFCPAVNSKIQMVTECYGAIAGDVPLLEPDKIEDSETMCKALTFARSTLKKYAKAVEAIADRIDAAAMAMSDAGTEIPYYVRVSKAGRKSISDYEKAFALCNLEPREFYSALTCSLPKLAVAYAGKHGMSQKDARKEVEGILDPVIETGESKSVLQKISKRGFGD